MKLKFTATAIIFAALYPPTAQAQGGPETFSLFLTASDIIAISQALADRPYKDVNQTIRKVDDQIQQQLQDYAKRSQQPKEQTQPPANTGGSSTSKNP